MLSCNWTPSGPVTQALSLSMGELHGGQLRFAPVPGIGWTVTTGQGLQIGRGGSAIDSGGGIHIAYQLQTVASGTGLEQHHLLLAK
jgi:hypothetical protein